MKIKAKINGNTVYIVQILFDELRSCPICVFVSGKQLLFGFPEEFEIIETEDDNA